MDGVSLAILVAEALLAFGALLFCGALGRFARLVACLALIGWIRVLMWIDRLARLLSGTGIAWLARIGERIRFWSIAKSLACVVMILRLRIADGRGE